ncbi:hypothetical protein [Brenneria alni]|uniref:hypothetical protein n=1 Tax=Brenneria alni TaxID=71656 RepID=UPI001473D36B|nr:hypothetical protein [Brenneria alni]
MKILHVLVRGVGKQMVERRQEPLRAVGIFVNKAAGKACLTGNLSVDLFNYLCMGIMVS